MNVTKLNEIVEKLESKYLLESAKGNEEAKEILAITQAYRILSIKAEATDENSGLHLQRASCCAFIEQISPMAEYIKGGQYKQKYATMMIPVIEYNELNEAAIKYDNEHCS